MKKSFLLCCLILLCMEVFSQKVRLGLRFAPGAAFSRFSEEVDSVEFKGKGVGLRFFAGPEVNFVLGENYVFTTGLWYMTKRAGMQVKDYSIEQVFNIQYLQLPATLKLYTNDIAVDTKLYFQFGATADIKLKQKTKVQEVINYVDKLRFFDASALVGAGLQLQMGQNTYFFAGITYSRGLIPSIAKVKERVTPNNEVLPQVKGLKNDLLALDFGLRF
jgi:hypothetical protein